MVGRNVGATFVPHIKKALFPFPADTDEVDLILHDAFNGNPCHFVHWSMRKERSSNHHVIVATKLCKQLSVFAHFSETMVSHDVLNP